MPLDLVVPDLFPPSIAAPERPDFRLPALERWLARATASREPGLSMRRWVAGRFGLADPVPYAVLSAAGEKDPLPGPPSSGQAFLMRADPVHLAVGQDSITLHEAGVLDVTPEEADTLVDALNDHFGVDGLVFTAAAPDRWYVRVPAGEVPSTTPIDDVAGGNVFRLLPRGTGSINWGSALTETQMLFAAHPVNAARESSGRRSINGVWFWGEGTLAATPPRAFDAVQGGDEVVRGLARLSGVEPPVGDTTVMWILDQPSRAIRAGDAIAWQRSLEALETQLFAALDNLALRYGTVRLVVPGREATRVFTAGRKPLLSWPKAPRPWTTHA